MALLSLLVRPVRVLRRLPGLALALVLMLCHLGAARALGVAGIDERRPVQDVTQSLTPVLEPAAPDETGHVPMPESRNLAFDDAFNGWSALTLQNPSSEPTERILVFSYPSLARAGLWGAPLAIPRLRDVRTIEGEPPSSVATSPAGNRFAALSVRLAPSSSQTYAFLLEHGSGATSVRAWDPEALARFDTFRLLAVGLFWGVLFVGVALMFAMRILSSGPGLLAGGFFALAALIFESAAFGFGGVSWNALFAGSGLDAAGVARSIGLILVGFFGLQFLRRLLVLREETPIVDLVVRVIQYALLVAVPLVFWHGAGPFAARSAAAIALIVAGLAVWSTRRVLPEALQLVPPGWTFLAFASIGVFAIAMVGLAGAGPVVELLLHGLFVIGVMLLVFSAAVRATVPAGIIEYGASSPVPAFAREEAPRPVREAATTAENSYQGLWDWNIAEDRLYVSPSVETMIGVGEGDLKGKERNWTDRIFEDDRSGYAETLQHYIQLGTASFIVEFRVRRAGGALHWLQLRATSIAGDAGRATRVIGVVTDITAAKTAEAELLQAASHDPLTGLGNRAFLVSQLDFALGQHRAHPVKDAASGKVLAPALILLDIDNFTTINDELGRAAGDELLKQIARRIEKAMGRGDVLARIGADEFALLLTPAEGKAGAAPAMEDPDDMTALLGDLFAQPLDLRGETVHPSAKVAFVQADDRSGHAQDFLAEAERALKRAKRGAPSEALALPAPKQLTAPEELPPPKEARAPTRVTLTKPQVPSELETDLRALQQNLSAFTPPSPLEADLRKAIQREQIRIAFQPIMSLSDRSLAGFEALMRWHHPERGLVPPDEFIPVAEESGLIVTLGRYALSMAAFQLSQWQSYFPLKRPLFVTVNVSSRQLLGEEFARDISEVLKAVELAPGSLKLEVTESFIFEDQAHVAKLLDTIKSKGVSIALDDYGQGHSNLNRLKALPVSTVKIDKEFVSGAGDQARSDTILRSTISMAHEMKLDVVAEGVEKEAQAQMLRMYGCDFAQGHLFGTAMTPHEAPALHRAPLEGHPAAYRQDRRRLMHQCPLFAGEADLSVASLAREVMRLNPQLADGARPLGVEVLVEQQVRVRLHMQPAIGENFGFELTRSPAGIAQSENGALGPLPMAIARKTSSVAVRPISGATFRVESDMK